MKSYNDDSNFNIQAIILIQNKMIYFIKIMHK